jgi:hypothetical protein
MPFAKLPGVVIDRGTRLLCAVVYPGHPRGCPKLLTCPERKGPFYDELFDTSEVWAIWNVFDFGAHVAKMRRVHPDWSQRQLECCLYWQGGARKALREALDEFRWRGWSTDEVVTVPEAMGVNVTATMAQLGVKLEWPPVTVAHQVALAARRRAHAVQP